MDSTVTPIDILQEARWPVKVDFPKRFNKPRCLIIAKTVIVSPKTHNNRNGYGIVRY